MKQTPIIFSGEMVRATLDDLKTQTRRLNGLKRVNTEPSRWELVYLSDSGEATFRHQLGAVVKIQCPYGQPGDQLWVRETWGVGRWGDRKKPSELLDYASGSFKTFYRASTPNVPYVNRWRPSIYLPKWAARIWRELTKVRVERLQDISENDAKAEGVTPGKVLESGGNPFKQNIARLGPLKQGTYRGAFIALWNELNAKRGHGWDTNPWAWALTFKRAEK